MKTILNLLVYLLFFMLFVVEAACNKIKEPVTPQEDRLPYFRLRQVDLDTKEAFSKIITLEGKRAKQQAPACIDFSKVFSVDKEDKDFILEAIFHLDEIAGYRIKIKDKYYIQGIYGVKDSIPTLLTHINRHNYIGSSFPTTQPTYQRFYYDSQGRISTYVHFMTSSSDVYNPEDAYVHKFEYSGAKIVKTLSYTVYERVDTTLTATRSYSYDSEGRWKECIILKGDNTERAVCNYEPNKQTVEYYIGNTLYWRKIFEYSEGNMMKQTHYDGTFTNVSPNNVYYTTDYTYYLSDNSLQYVEHTLSYLFGEKELFEQINEEGCNKAFCNEAYFRVPLQNRSKKFLFQANFQPYPDAESANWGPDRMLFGYNKFVDGLPTEVTRGDYGIVEYRDIYNYEPIIINKKKTAIICIEGWEADIKGTSKANAKVSAANEEYIEFVLGADYPTFPLPPTTIIFQQEGTGALTKYFLPQPTGLPIILKDFKATRTEKGIEIWFQTSSEYNSDYVEIQRSYDPANKASWETLTQIKLENNPAGSKYSYIVPVAK